MSKFKPRRILAVLGGIVLVLGGYVGWQVYQGQQLANQYVANAQKLAQGSGNGSAASKTQALGGKETMPAVSPAPTTPRQTTSSGTFPSSASSSPSSASGPTANPSAPRSASSPSTSNPEDYLNLS